MNGRHANVGNCTYWIANFVQKSLQRLAYVLHINLIQATFTRLSLTALVRLSWKFFWKAQTFFKSVTYTDADTESLTTFQVQILCFYWTNNQTALLCNTFHSLPPWPIMLSRAVKLDFSRPNRDISACEVFFFCQKKTSLSALSCLSAMFRRSAFKTSQL